MKKHWVDFEVTVHGSVLVEGDESVSAAERYVQRHVNIQADVEGEDAEINSFVVTSVVAFEQPAEKETT